jgi:hypothetical protein
VGAVPFKNGNIRDVNHNERKTQKLAQKRRKYSFQDVVLQYLLYHGDGKKRLRWC